MVSGLKGFLAALVMVSSSTLVAGEIHRVVVVGADSLSDTGNLSLISMGSQPPSADYEPGTFSNGPNWVDYVAAGLGLNVNDTALITGPQGAGFVDNYAVAGAFANDYVPTHLGVSVPVSNVADLVEALNGGTPVGVPGATAQFAAYTGAGIDPAAATVVWVGSNDLLFSPLLNPAVVVDATARQAFADAAATKVVDIVAALDVATVKKLAVLNLPDLGATPYADFVTPSDPMIGDLLQSLFGAAPDPSAAFSAFLSQTTSDFNTSLEQQLNAAGLGGTLFDLASSFADVVARPDIYGLMNVDDPCLTEIGMPSTVCDSPDQYLFWDDVHPTSAVHQILAGQLLQFIPVPAPLILLSLGLLGLLVRRKASAARFR